MPIAHVYYSGSEKVIIRLCDAVNALIDSVAGGGGDGTVANLIPETATANGTYSADGYSSVDNVGTEKT